MMISVRILKLTLRRNSALDSRLQFDPKTPPLLHQKHSRKFVNVVNILLISVRTLKPALRGNSALYSQALSIRNVAAT
jgi:hypothetical protein